MDSFFSLFDPSDGQSKSCHKKRHKAGTIDDNVRKKTEPNVPKGRRRGRRGQGKNETLPEESSFLCDPELSTELLVKDGSYIENYFEANHSKKYEEQKQQGDAKPKQRSSGRKSRRKKSKVSPAKDFAAHSGWSDELSDCVEDETLNNVSCPQPRRSSVVNKIVNNLRGDGEVELECGNKGRRKEGSSSFEEIQVNNVIDKLEKVSLKDDMYMAGEISAEDLENDVFYSSDDMDESYDDSDSELEATSDEVYGSLPPEPRFGNVEYKLQLVAPGERRLQHLVTQLKWRLISGGGSCIYVVGVRDCGALRGLRARALRGSLRTLRRMAAALRATLTHVTARRVTPHRAVAEVYIRKLADTQQSVELRVAVMGANEAGKSTLIGVLTQGELDNGRGSARLNMFRHVHEVRSGRTSSLSHEILGFDARGNVVNYGCSELMTAERIGERSAKLVSFLDLAGHSKYQHTTVHGLTGYSPHYAMLVVSATAGITRITEEHIDLLIALDLPFFTVLNKCELEPQAAAHTLARLAQLLAKTNKKPMLITDETLARECVAPPKLILDCIDEGAESVRGHEDQTEIVPVFPVSCVKGTGLNALHAYLLALQPPAVDIEPLPEEESCEFQIDEIFHVGDSAGPVVGGLQARGRLREGDNLLIGPLDTGEFVEISVKTIYRNRVPCSSVKAGQSASLGLTHHPPNLRQGMVLLAIPENYKKNNKTRPVFGRCPPGRCKSRNIKHIADTKNVKGVRRKEKNILQDLALVENCLKKTDDGVRENIFVDVGDKLAGSGETKKFGGDERNNNYCGDDADDSGLKFSDEDDKCYCGEEVPLDDPDDPRGCFYFQATLHLLRHSTPYIHPGFQCTVHVGNVRQTAVIEAIMSGSGVLRAGCRAQVVFRFVRAPEYVRARRRLLCRAGLATRAVGDTAQVFPHVTRC